MPRRKKAASTEDTRPATLIEAEQERDIAEDFQERQRLSEEGRVELAEKLREHHSLSPELAAGDVDAAWELGRMSGEETFTGHAPTPDQDRVDDMGAAAGLTYRDDEPLDFDKMARRDEHRWELDPRSVQVEEATPQTAEGDDAEAPLHLWDLADDLDAEVDDEDEEEDEEDEDEELDEDEEDLSPLAEEAEPDAEEEETEEDDEAESDLDQDDEDEDEDLESLDDLDDDEDDEDEDDD